MQQMKKVYAMDCRDFLTTEVKQNSVDLIVIDPPYNMRKADWDTFSSLDTFLDFSKEYLSLCIQTLKTTGSLYIFNTPYNCAYLIPILDGLGMKYRSWITWHKADGPGNSITKWKLSQECLLFYTKSDSYTFNADEVRVPYASGREHSGVIKNGKRWFPNPKGALCGDVWHFTSERHLNKVNGKTQKNEHLASKPLALIERVIKASSNEGDLVMDCFVGSGTTAIAAKALGRDYIVNDFDNVYAQMTIDKLEKMGEGNLL
jgi:site-specific DNA-methyltransferase (adenine-specific)